MNPKDAKRQVKLNELQDEHGRLTIVKRDLKKQVNRLTNDISIINKELNRLGGQIFDMKNEDGETPHITDHAVVRYLERVKGMNIWDIKAEIVAHRDAVRVINTIVTVNGNDQTVADAIKGTGYYTPMDLVPGETTNE